MKAKLIQIYAYTQWATSDTCWYLVIQYQHVNQKEASAQFTPVP